MYNESNIDKSENTRVTNHTKLRTFSIFKCVFKKPIFNIFLTAAIFQYGCQLFFNGECTRVFKTFFVSIFFNDLRFETKLLFNYVLPHFVQFLFSRSVKVYVFWPFYSSSLLKESWKKTSNMSVTCGNVTLPTHYAFFMLRYFYNLWFFCLFILIILLNNGALW